ncbi:RagB/SusD family nutrient uptake outer membrane protein [Sphingobacterium sp. WOUb80]|uniref:RagB/SusD family nutrient uptake outer membrane protein n=1 Tax=Sphingobacterium sp. WOUb80 TaxID=3234028 RepID=UPI003CE8854D
MKKITFLMLSLFIFCACSKDFLEEKSNQKLLVPNTLEDFQLLLDNNGIMNRTPGLGQIASDDFYITAAGFTALDELNKLACTWQLHNTNALVSSDWKTPYEQIFYSNIVLDGLTTLGDNSDTASEIRGQALFFRAYALFGLLQEFAPVYTEGNRTKDAIPVPLKSDISANRPIFKLEEVYGQVITDLLEAESKLPRMQTIKTRPSALAALSLLGRVYLVMGNYRESEVYLEKAVREYSKLIDYNSLSATSKRPFPTDFPSGTGNEEWIFYSPFINYLFLSYSNTEIRVNSEFVDLYIPNDLRKLLYFQDNENNGYGFKGSYSGSKLTTMFAGLSTDENYLNYAEVLLRNGKREEAVAIMNRLLKTRFKTGTYVDIKVGDPPFTLDYILSERRKSLIGKGLRWMDMRRLNNDNQYFIKAKKEINGEIYELKMNDERLQFQVPYNE